MTIISHTGGPERPRRPVEMSGACPRSWRPAAPRRIVSFASMFATLLLVIGGAHLASAGSPESGVSGMQANDYLPVAVRALPELSCRAHPTDEATESGLAVYTDEGWLCAVSREANGGR
jgi:hypothetical protein